MGFLSGLPDMGKIQAVLDEDFEALTQRLDRLIELEEQALAELQKGAPQ